MAQRSQVFKCNLCGHIAVLVHDGVGTLVCCSQPMQAVTENTTDASREKHVPVIEKTEEGYRVKVGSIPHPMAEDHYIEWIELVAGQQSYRQFLKPGDAPEAAFEITAETVNARVYCNLHGLWKG